MRLREVWYGMQRCCVSREQFSCSSRVHPLLVALRQYYEQRPRAPEKVRKENGQVENLNLKRALAVSEGLCVRDWGSLSNKYRPLKGPKLKPVMQASTSIFASDNQHENKNWRRVRNRLQFHAPLQIHPANIKSQPEQWQYNLIIKHDCGKCLNKQVSDQSTIVDDNNLGYAVITLCMNRFLLLQKLLKPRNPPEHHHLSRLSKIINEHDTYVQAHTWSV